MWTEVPQYSRGCRCRGWSTPWAGNCLETLPFSESLGNCIEILPVSSLQMHSFEFPTRGWGRQGRNARPSRGPPSCLPQTRPQADLLLVVQPVHSAEPGANPLLAWTCSNVRRTRQGGACATRPAGLLGGTLTPPRAAWPWGVIQRGWALAPRTGKWGHSALRLPGWCPLPPRWGFARSRHSHRNSTGCPPLSCAQTEPGGG